MIFDEKTIAEQLAICEATSKGKWSATKEFDGSHTVRAVYRNEEGLRCTGWVALCNGGGEPNAANSVFIEQSRNHYPAALHEIRVLERALELVGEGDDLLAANVRECKAQAREEVDDDM